MPIIVNMRFVEQHYDINGSEGCMKPPLPASRNFYYMEDMPDMVTGSIPVSSTQRALGLPIFLAIAPRSGQLVLAIPESLLFQTSLRKERARLQRHLLGVAHCHPAD